MHQHGGRIAGLPKHGRAVVNHQRVAIAQVHPVPARGHKRRRPREQMRHERLSVAVAKDERRQVLHQYGPNAPTGDRNEVM